MINWGAIVILLLQISSGLVFNTRVFRRISRSDAMVMRDSSVDVEVEFKIVSMNVLAPCYRKVSEIGRNGAPDRVFFEKDEPDRYLSRNEHIIDQLIASKADVICVQEFWFSNEEMQNLYMKRLCDDMDYTMKSLPRTSHWRKRDDGLAVFVKEERVFIQDYRDILFHDCGDRVAQMLLLAMRPEVDWNFEDEDEDEDEDEMPLQQFICVNTHLLFPHNEYSSKIRMREATKILGFVESYRQRELCQSVCSRSSVRVPVIVTGDFNGSPQGRVYNFICSQNYQSAFDNGGYSSLVTHMSHRNEAINVDHIFFLNPSDQTEDRLEPIPIPDWTNLVFRELKEKIIAQYGIGNFYEAFRSFDMNGSDYISKEEFSMAIRRLGFGSEGQPALTSDEIEVLVDSADKNGDGQIDFKEFCTRFWMADNDLESDEVDSSDDIGKDMEEQSIVAKLKDAKSTWLAQDLGGLSQGQGIGESVGTDDKWGLNKVPSVKPPGPDSDLLTDKPGKGSAARRRTVSPGGPKPQIILFEGDDAPGIWGEYSTELMSAKNRIQNLPDSRPMGDLNVKCLQVSPPELSRGEWPKDYSLSDHGMVEATFVGKCLRKDDKEGELQRGE